MWNIRNQWPKGRGLLEACYVEIYPFSLEDLEATAGLTGRLERQRLAGPEPSYWMSQYTSRGPIGRHEADHSLKRLNRDSTTESSCQAMSFRAAVV